MSFDEILQFYLIIMKNIKNIFFDFDGVLAESVQVKADAFYALYAPYGGAVATKVRQHHYENGGLSRFEKIAFCHKEFLGLSLSEDEVLVIAQEFSKLVLQGVINSPWVSGAHAFLEKHSYNMDFWIITGTPTSEIYAITEARNMLSYFNGLYGSPESKTHWAHYILNKWRLSNDETVFIGDAEQDRAAADNAGISFVLRNTPENQNYFKDFTGARLNDLTELEEVLLTL